MDALLAEPPGHDFRLLWLGQAGFVIDGHRQRVVVDPYLSDSLADKYRGTRFAHVRMMPIPIKPAAIRHVTAVLCTHAHTDHMDPGTLPELMASNPAAMLVAPTSERSAALKRSGIEPERLIPINSGQTHSLTDHLSISALPAAHERLDIDERGHHRYLGYTVQMGDCTLHHSGDTIPYDGQIEALRLQQADIALLPVNGRDEERYDNGIPGNMTVNEALILARETAIPNVIAHHFDMFAFNTVSRASIEAAASQQTGVHLLAARSEVAFHLSPSIPRNHHS